MYVSIIILPLLSLLLLCVGGRWVNQKIMESASCGLTFGVCIISCFGLIEVVLNQTSIIIPLLCFNQQVKQKILMKILIKISKWTPIQKIVMSHLTCLFINIVCKIKPRWMKKLPNRLVKNK